MSERAKGWLAIATLVALTAALFWPLVLGALTGEPRFFEWDVPEQYWPDLTLLCRSLWDGALPLWNPWDRGGYPVFADPQAGTWHPLNWAICALAGPAPGLVWATWRAVIGFGIAGLLGLGWLRGRGFSWGPALLGAALIEAAPFMRHNWELNLTLGLAFAPGIAWAVDRLVRHGRLRDGAALALATALCWWVGSPHAAWLGTVFGGIWLVGGLALTQGAPRRSQVQALLAAGALTLGLTAALVVPALELAAESVRAGATFEAMAADALRPTQLVALLWPQPGNHLYVGISSLLLAAFALHKAPERERWLAAGVAVIAVMLCLGEATPLFRLAWWGLPGASGFRLPHRYEAWLGLAIAPLVAMGLRELAARWPRARGIGPAVALVALLFLDVGRELPAERHTRVGAGPASLAASSDVLARAPGTRATWRLMDEFGIGCRSGTRLERRELRGYQDPLQLASFSAVIGSLREHPRLAEQLGVRFALTGPHFLHGWNRHFLPPRDALLQIPGATDAGAGVIELPGPMPLSWWVPGERIERVADRAAALDAVIAQAPSPLAVLEGGDAAPRSGGVSRLVPGRLRSYGTDALRLSVQAPGPGVLVVNEAWYPGWTATVNGEPVEVVRANGFVRAVEVAAGASDVVMRFSPPSGAPLRWLLALSWLASLAALVGPVGRRSATA